MRIIGKLKIQDFCQKHANTKVQFDAWLAEADEALWLDPHDVIKRYSTASFLGSGLVVFNIRGGKYRLVVKIYYTRKLILIERVGTHKEYDSWKL